MSDEPEEQTELEPVDIDLDEYDDDATFQQLSDIGQRLEIMLEAAGGPFEDQGEESPTSPADVPADVHYQRELTKLCDSVFIVAKLRKLVLRDEDDATEAAESESAVEKKGGGGEPGEGEKPRKKSRGS